MIRRLRLASGLTMLSYVTMHLLNHAVGLVSLDAMERVLNWVFALWSQHPAQTLLYGASSSTTRWRCGPCGSAAPCGCAAPSWRS